MGKAKYKYVNKAKKNYPMKTRQEIEDFYVLAWCFTNVQLQIIVGEL